MIIKEVKALIPLEDAYELRPEMRYLFTFDPSKVLPTVMESLASNAGLNGIQGAILCSLDGGVRIYELEPKT